MEKSDLKIRKASLEDLKAITQLFFDTITTINTKDYNPQQISTWSSFHQNTEGWESRIKEQHFFIAEVEDLLGGFSSVTDTGYIDLLFVHKDLQGQGIASALLTEVEAIAYSMNLPEIWADVSITAKPFFLKKGFVITKEYMKLVQDVEFKNTIMTKKL